MLDLTAIEGFEWDDGNALKSEAKHAVSRTEAEEVFRWDRVLLLPDLQHSVAETRYHAFGRTEAGRWLHVSFTVRGRRIRVISARAMNRKERRRYEGET